MDKKSFFSEALLVISIMVLMVFVCLAPFSKDATHTVFADEDTASSTDASSSSSDSSSSSGVSSAELAALTAEYTNTLQEKNALQTELNAMMESQNDFISKLNELDDMILEYQDKIDDIQAKIDQANDMETELENSIEIAQAQQDYQYELLKNHIQDEYENGSYSYLDAIFNAVDYMDIVNKAEYIQAIENYDEMILEQYKDAKRSLNDQKTLLEVLSDDMGVLQEAYENEQDSLEILSDEKEAQVNSYQEEIDAKKSELSTFEELEAQLSAQISSIEASSSVSVNISGGNVTYSGAQFLWPCPSSTTISSYYGNRTAPTAGATTYHRGIDIPCSMGSDIIAVADGTVIYVGYLGNAGNAVIVDHGSGISSCYFHLSEFLVSEGDSVTAGQTICKSGSTGVSTGPHLHFAVRENGEYVNPLKYYTMIEDKGNVSNTEGGESSNNTTSTDSTNSTDSSSENTDSNDN